MKAEIKNAQVWIESDLLGARHVVVKHEGIEAFRYATFHYHHVYTCNSVTIKEAEKLARQLGAVDPIEHRSITQ